MCLISHAARGWPCSLDPNHKILFGIPHPRARDHQFPPFFFFSFFFSLSLFFKLALSSIIYLSTRDSSNPPAVQTLQRELPKTAVLLHSDDSCLPTIRTFPLLSSDEFPSYGQLVGLSFFSKCPPWQIPLHSKSPIPAPPPSPYAVDLCCPGRIQLFFRFLTHSLPPTVSTRYWPTG